MTFGRGSIPGVASSVWVRRVRKPFIYGKSLRTLVRLVRPEMGSCATLRYLRATFTILRRESLGAT